MSIEDPRAAAQAADHLRRATGVESHDIALVMGSGWPLRRGGAG
ncbi:MAG: hypothetical protein R2709_13525 [Marmoricola sp.]